MKKEVKILIKNEIFFTPDRPQELLHDGIALVTVQVTLPQTERSGGRFNRYYRLWSKRFEQ